MQDVIIIGGGAAGLNAALILGRTRRSVTLIDAGQPRNSPAEAAHGFITRDGVSPLELLRLGRADLAPYDVDIVDGYVQTAEMLDGAFRVTLQDGSTVTGKRLLVTAGVVDELPDIPGLAERFGKDVAHCPFCHGWEIRDQAIGVIGSSTFAVHQALLFRQWSPNITLFLNSAPEPTDLELQQLTARGIPVITGAVSSVHTKDDAVTHLSLEDGTTHPLEALTVQSRVLVRAAFLAGLGLAPVSTPFGETIESDEMGKTSVPGVWVAGNITNLSATVLAAAQGGAMAGVAINNDLMAEELEQALAAAALEVG